MATHISSLNTALLELDLTENKPEYVINNTISNSLSTPISNSNNTKHNLFTVESITTPTDEKQTNRRLSETPITKNQFAFERRNKSNSVDINSEMFRKHRKHRGNIYNILTLEDENVLDENVFISNKDNDGVNSNNDRQYVDSNDMTYKFAKKMARNRHRYEKIQYIERIILYVSVVVFGVLSLIILILGKILQPYDTEYSLKYVIFDHQTGNLEISRNGYTMHYTLASAETNVPPEKFDSSELDGTRQIMYEYSDSSTLLLSEDIFPNGVCTHLNWLSKSPSLLTAMEVCFSLRDAFWYGGSERYNQTWPIDTLATQEYQPFVSTDFLNGRRDSFGPVLHPAWFSSKGAAVLAATNESYLHVKLKYDYTNDIDDFLCVSVSYKSYFLSSSSIFDMLQLKLDLCLFDNIVSANKYFLNTLASNNSFIEKQLFPDPIWSTWAMFKRDIDQDKVLSFWENIITNQFNASILEIDDGYSSLYGDFEFNKTRFPDPLNMIQKIKSTNTLVSLWVYPFTNTDSDAFQLPMTKLLNENKLSSVDLDWVFCSDGQHTLGLVRWWRGYGVLLDTTSNKATEMFYDKLVNLSNKYQIDSFKFAGGEASYLPRCDLITHPNTFTQRWAELASRFPNSEVRVGYNTQNYQLAVRMLDKETKWGLDNGLHSVLTSSLTLSILGYPFIIPDMIGGNNYAYNGTANLNIDNSTNTASEELYVRWLALSAFMPYMQFSVVPWVYSPQVTQYALNMTGIHHNLVTHVMNCIARNFSRSHEPILRPLWWHWPEDEFTFQIDDQFMIGDLYLVAPCLQEGKTARSVYLPEGEWRAMNGTDVIITQTEGSNVFVTCELFDIPSYYENLNSQLAC